MFTKKSNLLCVSEALSHIWWPFQCLWLSSYCGDKLEVIRNPRKVSGIRCEAPHLLLAPFHLALAFTQSLVKDDCFCHLLLYLLLINIYKVPYIQEEHHEVCSLVAQLDSSLCRKPTACRPHLACSLTWLLSFLFDCSLIRSHCPLVSQRRITDNQTQLIRSRAPKLTPCF